MKASLRPHSITQHYSGGIFLESDHPPVDKHSMAPHCSQETTHGFQAHDWPLPMFLASFPAHVEPAPGWFYQMCSHRALSVNLWNGLCKADAHTFMASSLYNTAMAVMV